MAFFFKIWEIPLPEDFVGRYCDGVRQVEAKVQNQGGENPVNVQISIVLGQNYSAPEVSALVKSEIQKALQTALQISNVPIDVKVTEVTHAVVEREKRVV